MLALRLASLASLLLVEVPAFIFKDCVGKPVALVVGLLGRLGRLAVRATRILVALAAWTVIGEVVAAGAVGWLEGVVASGQ